jgi:uncharacterized delta-60 repeat protein
MKKTLLIIILIILKLNCIAQPGTLDMSFNPDDIGNGNGDGIRGIGNYKILATKLQNDGKIIIAGSSYYSYNDTPVSLVTRLNNNGKLDTSFVTQIFRATSFIGTVSIQSDGKIIIGGRFCFNNGNAPLYNIARLNNDGSIDSSFNLYSMQSTNFVYSTAIQNDGKIIIAGNFTTYNGETINRIARLNIDGTLDNTFNIGSGANNTINTVGIQNDGKIVIGGEFTSYNGTNINRIARLNIDGSLDNTFNTASGSNRKINTVAIQTDGKIVMGGEFTSYNGTTINRIARLNIDGSLDNTFNTGSGSNSSINTVGIQNDGKIIIGGSISNYNGTFVNRLIRLNIDGTLDNSFYTTSRFNIIYSVAIQTDGKIISGSYDYYGPGLARQGLLRLNNNGTIDTTFNSVTGASSIVATSINQPNGKLLIAGSFSTYNNEDCSGIVRINNDGSTDNTFNNQNILGDIVCLAMQNDGKIIVGGGFYYINNGNIIKRGIVRLNSDGTLDNSFNISGTGLSNNATVYNGVACLAIQNDGKIIIGGAFTSYNGVSCNNIARLNSDGTFDISFNLGNGIAFDGDPLNSNVNTIAIQNDGKIIIGGNFSSYNGIYRGGIARLNSDGTLDSAINTSTFIAVNKIIIQDDGKIIIGGNFSSYNGIYCRGILRLNNDGNLDSSFNFNINTAFGNYSTLNINLAIQNNAKIIIVGNFYDPINNTNNHNIIRLNPDGTIDTTFNSGIGCNNEIRSTSIQPDGKIIIGGIFTSYDGIGRNRIARINGDSTLDTSLIEKNSMVIYPNPVTNLLQIQTPNNVIISSTRILDISGKLIFEQKTNSNSINTEILTKGFYILEVFSGKDKFTCKFIKE